MEEFRAKGKGDPKNLTFTAMSKNLRRKTNAVFVVGDHGVKLLPGVNVSLYFS